MSLTRATFAVMVKMAGLVRKFEELMDDLSMEKECTVEALLSIPNIHESGLL
jgi:hypothetical protein